MNPSLSRYRRNLLSFFALVGFFLIWELACRALHVSDLVLPKPSQIVVVLVEKMPILWPHTLQTLMTTLTGFFLGVIAGLLLGMLIGSSKLAYDIAYPLLVGFSSIPKVAVCQFSWCGLARVLCQPS